MKIHVCMVQSALFVLGSVFVSRSVERILLAHPLAFCNQLGDLFVVL